MVNDTRVIFDDDAARLEAVEALAGPWLTLDEISSRFDMSLNQVRRLLAERDVIGLRLGSGGPKVPAAFFEEAGPLPALKGTLSVLGDGGFSDLAAIEWLFTADDTLPQPGTPVDNLIAGFKTEIRRRAMEEAV